LVQQGGKARARASAVDRQLVSSASSARSRIAQKTRLTIQSSIRFETHTPYDIVYSKPATMAARRPAAYERKTCCQLAASVGGGKFAKLHLCRRPGSADDVEAGAVVATADSAYTLALDLPRDKATALASPAVAGFVDEVCEAKLDTVLLELRAAAKPAQSPYARAAPASAAAPPRRLLRFKLSRRGGDGPEAFRERVCDAVWEALELVRTQLKPGPRAAF
jgi:hypothetical protein